MQITTLEKYLNYPAERIKNGFITRVMYIFEATIESNNGFILKYSFKKIIGVRQD